MSELIDRAKLFRSSARFYLSNKKLYESLLESTLTVQNERILDFISKDLLFVENCLEEINEKCGSAARLIVYLLYIENRTQEDVAGDYNLTRRQLQYSLSKWMGTVFSSE